MEATLTNRRRFLSVAIAASTAAIPATVSAAAPEPSEVDAIFEQLNPERKKRMLLTFRDCLAAQRLIERGAAVEEAGR
jgi:hypothetical protein